MKKCLGLLVCVLLGLQLQAQTVVKGVVTDKDTRQPLPFVNVVFAGTTAGTRTDANGVYTLKSNNAGYTQVHFSFLGYKAIVRNITPGQENTIDVALKPEAQILTRG